MMDLRLVTILAVLVLAIGVPLVITLVLLWRSKATVRGPNHCPACQGCFAGAARFCPHCGQAMVLDL